MIAHRGFSGRYPENTGAAFRAALQLGVDAIELDVHLSADGALIVVHDHTVNRTSDGVGEVKQLTLDEIRGFDAGNWLSADFAGERFLTLEEALDSIGGDTRLNVHVKAEEETREQVVGSTIRALGEAGCADHAFIASDEATIRLSKEIHPDLSVCNLSTQPIETYIERSVAAGCEIVQPSNRQVNCGLVDRAHEAGLEVNPFFADDEVEMDRLIDSGADGILTNYPDRLLDLRERSRA